MSADLNAEWAKLSDHLRSRYPDDWAERYQSYQDGYNADLMAWRKIGGEPYTPSGRPAPQPSPITEARNRRILAAARAAVPVSLIAERFGLTVSAVYGIAASYGERVTR
jgi:hypothetical protein